MQKTAYVKYVQCDEFGHMPVILLSIVKLINIPITSKVFLCSPPFFFAVITTLNLRSILLTKF